MCVCVCMFSRGHRARLDDHSTKSALQRIYVSEYSSSRKRLVSLSLCICMPQHSYNERGVDNITDSRQGEVLWIYVCVKRARIEGNQDAVGGNDDDDEGSDVRSRVLRATGWPSQNGTAWWWWWWWWWCCWWSWSVQHNAWCKLYKKKKANKRAKLDLNADAFFANVLINCLYVCVWPHIVFGAFLFLCIYILREKAAADASERDRHRDKEGYYARPHTSIANTVSMWFW